MRSHDRHRDLYASAVGLALVVAVVVLWHAGPAAPVGMWNGGPYPTGTPTATRTPTPPTGSGSCCSPHGSASCTDLACVNCMCITGPAQPTVPAGSPTPTPNQPIDPFCCTGSWDAHCVGEAHTLCGAACACPITPPRPSTQYLPGRLVPSTPVFTVTATPGNTPFSCNPNLTPDACISSAGSCKTVTPIPTPTITPTPLLTSDCCQFLLSCQVGGSCPSGQGVIVTNAVCVSQGFSSVCIPYTPAPTSTP